MTNHKSLTEGRAPIALLGQKKRLPRKLKKGIKKCWKFVEEYGTTQVTFSPGTTRDEQKARARMIVTCDGLKLPLWNGGYITFRQDE